MEDGILEAAEPTVAPGRGTADDGPSSRRPRWPVVVLVVTALVLVGAVVFAVLATSDRNDAAGARRTARHLLAVQRTATQRAESSYDDLRTMVQAGVGPVAAVVTSTQGLVSLADQGTQAAKTVQGLGADPTTTPDAYNGAIDTANAITAQYDAMLHAVDDQLRSLGGSTSNGSTKA